MKCRNCGREIANDSQFCEYCGTKVNFIASSTVSEVRDKGKATGWIVVSVLLFLSNVICGWLAYDYKEQLYRKDSNYSQKANEVSRLESEVSQLRSDNSQKANEVSRLEAEVSQLRSNVSTLEDEVRTLEALNSSLNYDNNDSRERVLKRYRTKYDDQQIYYRTCSGGFSQLGCHYSDKNTLVYIYTQVNGYGLTVWGWIPMNRLEKY